MFLDAYMDSGKLTHAKCQFNISLSVYCHLQLILYLLLAHYHLERTRVELHKVIYLYINGLSIFMDSAIILHFLCCQDSR